MLVGNMNNSFLLKRLGLVKLATLSNKTKKLAYGGFFSPVNAGTLRSQTAAFNTGQDAFRRQAMSPDQVYNIPAFAPKAPVVSPAPARQPAVANLAQQFGGVNDPKAAPARVTGEFTGDNGLTAPTSTHFNPVTAAPPFNPNQVSQQDLAWFRKETGTKFNPRSIADVNYFLNRKRNNQTQAEADGLERTRRNLAPQNAADNTAQLRRLVG